MVSWGEHVYRVGTEEHYDVKDPGDNVPTQKKHIEPWLSAVFQSEHLSLLLGSGFTTAVAYQAGVKAADMSPNFEGFPFQEKLEKAARDSAAKLGRGEPNIEDQIRVSNTLLQGLQIVGATEAKDLQNKIDALFKDFLSNLLQTERGIRDATEASEERIDDEENSSEDTNCNSNNLSVEEPETTIDPLVMLVSFLLSFSSRTASRERLHIFTTNYDRLIEYGADLAGLHILDRFTGALEPIFRSSRLDIDMHYNPPGIRGEPRYLEGVVRLTKLHGSLDWSYRNGFVRKIGLPFGAGVDHLSVISTPSESVMVYPNAAKDRETSEYPYVELFRDYAAAVCRPNSVLVTYGYGFGDEHINRVIADMLTIPSTHLVIISFGDEGGRISAFSERIGRKAQISLLLGPHFAAMPTLVEHYLPKPAIDRITIRQTDLLRNRGWEPPSNSKAESSSEGDAG